MPRGRPKARAKATGAPSMRNTQTSSASSSSARGSLSTLRASSSVGKASSSTSSESSSLSSEQPTSDATNVILFERTNDEQNNYDTSISPVTQDSYEQVLTLTNKVAFLTDALDKVTDALNKDTQAAQIVNLNETIDLMKRKEEIHKNQLKYWSEKVKHISSMSSKKGRMKATMREKKSLKRVMRDVMIAKIFPFMKFCTQQHLNSLKDNSMGVTIMNELNIEKEKRFEWWATNHEIAEGLLTEHKTSTGQNMKHCFYKGIVLFIMLLFWT